MPFPVVLQIVLIIYTKFVLIFPKFERKIFYTIYLIIDLQIIELMKLLSGWEPIKIGRTPLKSRVFEPGIGT